MAPPWRYRCPEGHSSIQIESYREKTYRCRTCNEAYDKVLDAKTGKLVSELPGRPD